MAEEEARGMIYLRSLQLTRGYSGVKPSTFKKYLALLSQTPLPLVPSQGSVGACGDLAPLAHAAQWVFAKIPDEEIGPRDGLALINGTEASSSVSLLAALCADRLLERGLGIAALTLFAAQGKTEGWDLRLVGLKKHPHSNDVAKTLTNLLGNYRSGGLPQDPYSFRAVPQIAGGAREIAKLALDMLQREASSVTDNPPLMGAPKNPFVLYGANFHGIYPAIACDLTAWAVTILGIASERRTDFLLSGSRELPQMLALTPGSSGLMMTQVVQASLVAENRLLSQLASTGSIPTSGSQEDVVPMSMGAALKLKRALLNYSRILAIEALAASRAIALKRRLNQLKAETKLSILHEQIRQAAGGAVESDSGSLTEAIEKIAARLRSQQSLQSDF